MTTRTLPVLDYSDAFRILCLEGGNGTIVNDASEQVMLRIEKTMARLKVMGDDAREILEDYTRDQMVQATESNADKAQK